ncbi:DUF2946 family protein [Ottowia sp.]|uniref:DUF2946 family protein n=1 Tax=Ottowia sp. TaxID=1898956 RepID=UPI002CBDB791|nr:DUF2946 family protein [Ottowia sp.]HOB66093.1 DUF2946 family protein [Ottowia sp.]HPZ57805.1 DUF2946 family protein [Ottowia sp.]HQD48036.1 DUF2946 family protein [Ottowia sp.]
MDDIVRQAMAKWPNVPHCHGWLGLDARGNWYLRDGDAQALGGFASGVPGAKGALLQHQKLIEFIQRNYDHDAAGQWFFQNGPQRVFVELQAAPWVWRVAGDGSVTSHTGVPAQVREVLADESGRVFMATDIGLGLVHTQDMGAVADALERGAWPISEVRADALPSRFGFVLSPQARQAAG